MGLAFGLVICAGLSTTIGRACHACDDPFLFSITTYVDKGTIAEGGVGGRGTGGRRVWWGRGRRLRWWFSQAWAHGLLGIYVEVPGELTLS